MDDVIIDTTNTTPDVASDAAPAVNLTPELQEEFERLTGRTLSAQHNFQYQQELLAFKSEHGIA